MKFRLQLDILRSQYMYYPYLYLYVFQSAVESSSSLTECFLLRIYSDSCSIRILLLCDC